MTVFKHFIDGGSLATDYELVCRYIGVKIPTPSLLDMAVYATEKVLSAISPVACYSICHIQVCEETVDFGFAKMHSPALANILSGCDRAVIFAVTLGTEADRIISRYSKTDMSLSLACDGAASMLIESACDSFCEYIENSNITEGKGLTMRFSPGYGGLNIEHQRDIFRFLDCPKNIGLTLTDSFMMAPAKSITAIAGIGEKYKCSKDKCQICENTNCSYRKG